MTVFFCSWYRAIETLVPEGNGEPTTLHSLYIDSPGPLFMLCAALLALPGKFLEKVRCFGRDLLIERLVASIFCVFVFILVLSRIAGPSPYSTHLRTK